MPDLFVTLYERRLADGEIAPDPAQRLIAERLGRLAEHLQGRSHKRSGFVRLIKSGSRSEGVRGLYIHGAVGRGKTMLMDMFHDAVPFTPKRRVHFHELMSEVHDRIRSARDRVKGDPIPVVATEIASEAGLLCLDELQVTDIADAMILGRLFKGFLDSGMVVVATSNSAPGQLYENGLNRQLFLPFIDMICNRMEVVALNSAKDYRLDKLAGQQHYFTPLGASSAAGLEAQWRRLIGRTRAAPAEIQSKGRTIRVPLAAMGAARFTFADLCEQPLGAADYLAVAHAFHTVILEGIPCMGPEQRNEARRFVNLIDTLYDNRVCLIATAAAEPGALYRSGDGASMFERTVSRLVEMQSEEYLARRPAEVRCEEA